MLADNSAETTSSGSVRKMKPVSIALLAGMVICTFLRPVSAAPPTKFKEKVLWSFGNGADGAYPEASLINVNGVLYGTTETGGIRSAGTVFSLDPSTGVEKVLHSFCSKRNCGDGAYPVAGLIDVDGTLYGTTPGGGTYQSGTVSPYQVI